MSPKAFGLASAAGLASGLVILSVIAGSGAGMLLAYVAPLPLLLIGLSFGLGPVLAAIAVGSTLVAVAGVAALPVFLAIGALPALLLTVAALVRRKGSQEWSGAGVLLVAVALGSVAVTGLLTASLPIGDQTMEAWLRGQAAPLVESGLPGIEADVKTAIIAMWTAVLPALIGCAWFAMTVVNGALAQWAVGHAKMAARPSPDLGALRLPWWLAAAAAALGGLSLLGGDEGFMARNLAILLLLPFLAAGLVDIHRTLRQKKQGGLWLGLFYGVFVALIGWAAVAVTAWGLVRQFVRSRRPEPARPPSDADGNL